MNQYLSVALLPVVAWIIYKAITARSKNNNLASPYPPGPKPKPIIGNLLDFPQVDILMSYRDMSKTYGSELSGRLYCFEKNVSSPILQVALFTSRLWETTS